MHSGNTKPVSDRLDTGEQSILMGLNLPRGMSPAVVESLHDGVERALHILLSVEPAVLKDADHLAALLTTQIQPNVALIEERIQRMGTIKKILEEDDWLTAEQLNALQPAPPANKSHPASDWKRRDRIFSVSYGGKEYFARYQFDALYQPLPIIKDILKAFGEVADAWKIAAWFHFPNGWITESVQGEDRALAPKDALDRRGMVLSAAAKRHGRYVA